MLVIVAVGAVTFVRDGQTELSCPLVRACIVLRDIWDPSYCLFGLKEIIFVPNVVVNSSNCIGQ